MDRARLGMSGALVHHLAAFRLDIQVRDVEVRDGLERRRQRVVHLLAAVSRSHRPANVAESAENLCSIESLAFAVFTEAHD